MSDFSPGDRVNWSFSTRGGYGYTQIAAGIVRKVGPKRITIEVAERDIVSRKWVRKLTSVKSENLSPRSSLCEQLGETEATNLQIAQQRAPSSRVV